jgi:hypothetical protein
MKMWNSRRIYSTLISYAQSMGWDTADEIVSYNDPMSCAEYVQRNGLLDTPGRKRFKQIG